jgi:hypothetical protein
MSNWTYRGEFVESIPEVYDNFVYLITNLVSCKKYIGKKKSYSLRTLPPLKGQKRKRKIVKESDWKIYYGSNDELNADVLLLGEENFSREILHWCRSKAEASYLEAYEQFIRKAIIDPSYYNGWLSVRVTSKHLKLMSEEFNEQFRQT